MADLVQIALWIGHAFRSTTETIEARKSVLNLQGKTYCSVAAYKRTLQTKSLLENLTGKEWIQDPVRWLNPTV